MMSWMDEIGLKESKVMKVRTTEGFLGKCLVSPGAVLRSVEREDRPRVGGCAVRAKDRPHAALCATVVAT